MMLQVLDSCPSTNAAINSDAPHGLAIMALDQTAGRGQRGNHWEAAAGKNVTMSIMLRPEKLAAREQFLISKAVALGVTDVVKSLVPEADKVKIKWPNDIYVGDKKIAGILIENSVSGSEIRASIAGIGLNVNQHLFLSDAPNPVSIFQLSGQLHQPQQVAQMVLEAVMARFDKMRELDEEYFAMLYRREGLYFYRDCQTGERFRAQITAIAPDGRMTLTRPSGEKSHYYFKEVAFV